MKEQMIVVCILYLVLDKDEIVADDFEEVIGDILVDVLKTMQRNMVWRQSKRSYFQSDSE